MQIWWASAHSLDVSTYTLYTTPNKLYAMFRPENRAFINPTSLHDLTLKFQHTNTLYKVLGLISLLRMALMQPWWRRSTWCTRTTCIGRGQISHAIVPEIHSHREWYSQGPNPPPAPYPWSWLWACLITMTNMSARVCGLLSKYSDTEDLSVLLCVILNRWPFTLRWNGWPVCKHTVDLTSCM